VSEPTGQQGDAPYVQSWPVKVLAETFVMLGGFCTTTTLRDAVSFELVVATIRSCQGVQPCVALETMPHVMPESVEAFFGVLLA